MSTAQFFDESREQSLVKAEIVEKYFDAWAGIITATQNRSGKRKNYKIGYVDLFAGPGRYKDGAISTPIRILQKAVDKNIYARRLVTIFNDKDEDSIRSLQEAIDNFPNIKRLRYKPQVWNEDVGDQIAKAFSEIDKIPILAFIDPWGYKGLSLKLVDAFLGDWGCDCIFFFNYARINAGLSNPKVKEHMEALFGQERASSLSKQLSNMKPKEREATIVNELAVALKEFGHRYVLPFCFKNSSGVRTTHHLIFVTKSFKGYEVMKEIMAKASSENHQGVPSFVYSPAISKYQQVLFELNRPLYDLRNMLLAEFRGKTLTMKQIYRLHSVDRPFLSRNYKEVLKKMEDDGLIRTKGRKIKRGFADHILVSFPK